MARKDRTGNRKTREERMVRRIPELGYYLVITDTEATERNYFTGLHDSLPKKIQNKLVIKVVETKTQNMIQKCLDLTAYDAQYRIPWIVFDRDQVPNFDEIVSEAKSAGIQVGWSNPCFEIWMYAYLSFENLGIVVTALRMFMKSIPAISILKLIQNYISASLKTEMKKRR